MVSGISSLLWQTSLIGTELFAGSKLDSEVDMHDVMDWTETDYVCISFIVWSKSLIIKIFTF